MKKTVSILSVLLTLALLAFVLTACFDPKTASTTTGGKAKSSAEGTVTTAEIEALAKESDVTVDTGGATKILLDGSAATVNGSGAKADGSTVTVTAGGTYEISGTLSDGRIVVDAEGADVTLVLNNANITCSSSSAIFVYQAKSATLYLAQGTSNTLSDGSSYTYSDSYSSKADEEPNACLYAKDDLIIAGSGSLTVNGNFNNGITGKDTLKIESTALTVKAKNHGVNGKDSLTLKKATVSVTAAGDALRASNDTDTALGYVVIADSTVTLESGEDGIQAETRVSIGGTTLTVKSGGGHEAADSSSKNSAKGVKAGAELNIDSGVYSFDCADDALHADGNLTVNGGDFTLTTADDGLHADNTVTVNAGKLNITGHEGIESTVVKINDGAIVINASDDGINAAKKTDGVTPTVEINGGEITVNMGQGDTDGIDSNGNIVINGGTVTVNAQSPFDYDGTGTINGGTVTVNGTQVTSLSSQFGGGMQGGGRGGRPEDGQVPQDGQTPQDGQIPQGKHPSGGRGSRSQTTTTTEAETA